jgi:hypothetical protein
VRRIRSRFWTPRYDNFWVSLTGDEVRWAVDVGAERNMRSWERGGENQHGLDPEDGMDLSYAVEGSCAELAYAIWRGVPWEAHVDTFKKPDVDGYQVRRAPHKLKMIVRPKDSVDEQYALVTGGAPEFWVRGWLWGREARQDEYLMAPNGRPKAWFVPASDLRVFEESTHATASARREQCRARWVLTRKHDVAAV